jgi:hypothetical protein
MEFFKAWLLLIDVLHLDSFADPQQPFEPIVRAVHPNAVAARHWYKSACEFQGTAATGATVPVGLPGHFSVRGDWFLAVASASRSSRLADRALDLLSSRRANFVRMQSGLGLPTRDLAGPDAAATGHRFPSVTERIRTRLTAPSTHKSPARGVANRGVFNVTYDDLRRLGPPTTPSNFHWLWRSSFPDYDLLSTIWQKSLVRIALAWRDLKAESQHDWISGFEIYDLLEYYTAGRLPAPVMETDINRTAIYTEILRESSWRTDDPRSWQQFQHSWKNFQMLCELTLDFFRQPMGAARSRSSQL